MKKIIIIIIAIILISLTILGILYLRNKVLTKNEFLELMEKQNEITNMKIEEYIIEGFSTIVGSTTYIKDDLRLVEIDTNVGFFIWANLSTKEIIYCYTEWKEYAYKEMENSNGLEVWDEWDYTFLRYERYNGVRCAVGEFKHKEMNHTVTLWINAHNGVLLKNVNNRINSEGKPFETIEEYKVLYNIVTDEDVARPNLEGYYEMLPDEGGEVIIRDYL